MGDLELSLSTFCLWMVEVSRFLVFGSKNLCIFLTFRVLAWFNLAIWLLVSLVSSISLDKSLCTHKSYMFN